ncbi:hypothetical protein C8Q76DRAFT_173664 [Earliella scabrosa]|nr:hypothetical protein C8Q76DRAFT_173664 [Earliella scabrosa]
MRRMADGAGSRLMIEEGTGGCRRTGRGASESESSNRGKRGDEAEVGESEQERRKKRLRGRGHVSRPSIFCTAVLAGQLLTK